MKIYIKKQLSINSLSVSNFPFHSNNHRFNKRNQFESNDIVTELMRNQKGDCQQQQQQAYFRKPPDYFGAREFRVDPKQRRSSIVSTHAPL